MIILDIYHSLLVDIADLTGYSEIRAARVDMQWVLFTGPQLEKYMLDYLEDRDLRHPSTVVPAWLTRLAVGSITDPIQLRYLRQLLLFAYKAEVTHDHKTTTAAVQNYLDTNRVVGEYGEWLQGHSPRLLNSARRLIQSVLHRCRFADINPQFGPGAVTNRASKLEWSDAYCQIDSMWPLSDFMCLSGNREHMEFLDNRSDVPIEAKLTPVPKDSRGPRLICVHPSEAVWFQQGVRKELERAITARDVDKMSPGGRIFFASQTANGRIALCSSRSRRYATIDLSEASDRISDRLLQVLLGRHYKWFGACRATNVRVNDEVHHLNAYAPMGNATVFPIQSLIFWAICVAALHDLGDKTPNRAFVFGDDIVIPSYAYEHVTNALSDFGLKVNTRKSFHEGFFRESCGVDAYLGIDVTPIRWKLRLCPNSHDDCVALCDIAKRLTARNYHTASEHIYWLVGILLAPSRKRLYYTNNFDHGGVAKYTPITSLVFGESTEHGFTNASWHSDYQWFYTPVWRMKLSPIKEKHGWNHVLRALVGTASEQVGSMDNALDHRVRYSRSFRLKREWTPVL